ncbi:hypothetical protein FOJ82_08430 [Tessaracoccus rhinocerotis]|uniref:Uncharacterized protein n=1 Tax=Tessaracoccus rhinocerotis TaxID=1689449 RepID=A0A553K053_9ACTN|nr:hypothetical protein [Tessaracoccus rhinocerotis]TRY18074.1 hypothetical protein FOJ82_08430 [Tessaracoccus rhinocerotis]
MLPVQQMVSNVMKALGQAEQAAAGNYEYSQAREEISSLRAAVNAAIQQDEAEASSFWTELSRLGRHTFNYFSERQRFNQQAAQAKASALAALAQVENFCNSNVAPHANVPARLTSDAAEWTMRSRQVRAMYNRAKRLTNVEGWSGEAREQYSAAAAVQANALSELEGVMVSTAAGAGAGATLNRAIFYVVGKAVRVATSRIKSAPGSNGDQYYLRTATATNECRSLLFELAGAVSGKVAAGSANALSSELAKTITLPNLLEVGSWPTGTSAAGRAPANTGDTVDPDGGSTNLNTGGGSGGGTPGVDL